MIIRRDPDAVIATLAFWITSSIQWKHSKQLKAAASLAVETGKIVTLGIPPDGPETGYGYLQMGQMLGDIHDLTYSEVLRFIEKPDHLSAERYLREGGYLWNSGMFIFTAERILTEMGIHQSEIMDGITEIVESGNDRQILEKVFSELPSISVDTGVMERIRGILGMPSRILTGRTLGVGIHFTSIFHLTTKVITLWVSVCLNLVNVYWHGVKTA